MPDLADRLVALDSVYNFRDFGGYSAGEGRQVARGRLYRSAHMARASDQDLERIKALGIAVIADLRRTGERTAEPNREPEGCSWRVISSDKGFQEELPPHLQFLRDLDVITPEAVHDYMLAVYEGIPYDERHVEMFGDVFAALVETSSAETSGGLLVHCAAGKDRTGVLCALILDALGVPHEHVVRDYEMTNRAVNLEGIIEQAAARISRRVGREVKPEEVRPLASVNRDYLDVAWKVIEAQSGSVANYRREVLGFTDEHAAALRAGLVESV
ncbi:MAG: tyrosine-protein phosphatase [Maricaulaceae bacterium]|jgi:protein-tyrosine phosphatase